LSHNYRFVEDEQSQKIPIPKRVQILIDEYLKVGRQVNPNLKMHYDLETIDRHESLFELKLKERPDTLKVIIHQIYRVKHDNQEYYFYNATKTCKNALNSLEIFSYSGYGHHLTPKITMRWNETTQKSEPTVTGYEHGFELLWNKAEVKKLLDSSTVVCEQFHIGRSGPIASEPLASPYYQIQNKEDFLNGSFEDLWDLGRLGLSYKSPPSLYLVEPGRKQERQNIEKNVGLRDKQGLYA
jgi:hypothetical protein